ncbi:glycosyltransferase family 4 protein [Plesiomonas shigelloides]|uniref:glycosyltransferase family 4 protein n=1 Tax=Plesiomonas shigelloides TaxID=703 RepID=UPI0017826C17|nr:glycosyltransferase family 1 protein [Plesiomonas shigelloides]MDT1011874.1 glycosyltransferase family 1 protein [Plesiomonas shigelloides]QLL91190.1 glycosyltransferase family 1 protein [Plesiomonas shigelloides]QOH79867.1 glycosyltransferase family 4 protein [Plesiomonas shigelloides]
MIIYDGIIEKLQQGGGVTVVFNELIKRLNHSYLYFSYESSSHIANSKQNHILSSRLFERYRDAQLPLELLGEAAVFHSTYYRLPANANLPVVTTVHDFTYEKFVKGPAKWVHSYQKNRAIRNSDVVICVSHNTAKDLQQYCPIDPKKIRVIYNGVSDSYHPLSGISGEQSQDVVFVGARSGYKNFRLAVESVAAVPNLRLQIVGGGKLSEDEIKHLDAHLPNRYQWLGRLSDEELNEIYNQAYALLYPSNYEGFGIPVIEAMRAGCPVIAVNVSSIPEVAGDAAILVDKPTVAAFSEALIKLSTIRKQLISAGFTQAAKFSWDRCFEETLAVYNELLAK